MIKNISVAILFLGFSACTSMSTKRAPAADYSGHGGDSVSSDTIAQFAPPTLPNELNRKIQNYLDIRAPGIGLLSHDGKELFFTWTVTGSSQIWKLSRPLGFPIQLTGGEDRTTIGGITADGKFLLIQRDRNGEEYPGLYLQKTSGGPLEVIQHLPKIQTQFQFVDKNNCVYFTANDLAPNSYALYKYNLKTKSKELLLSEPGIWNVVDHHSDQVILLSKQITNVANEIYKLDLRSRSLKPILGQGKNNEYIAQFGAQKDELIVITAELSDFRRLYRFHKGKLDALSPNMEADISNVSVDQTRQHILYEINDKGYTRTRALDAKTFKELNLPQFPDADHVTFGEQSEDGQSVMLGIEKATSPRLSFSYNWTTGKITQWLIPSQPEVDTSRFARASLEYYPSRDGVQIPMFVRRPAQCLNATSPCPVVVRFHGGPESQAQPGFSLSAQLMIDEGFILVEPNVRGSEGYGRKWLDLDNGAKRLNVITDIEDAALYIRKNWAINGQSPKIGVTGGSYGGYSTLMAMTRFAGAFDVGVSNVGMSNLLTFLQNTAPYRRALRTPEYGDPEKDRDALIQLSPLTYINQIQGPLMVIQGATDPRVPVGEAIQMYQAVKGKGIDSQLIIFADEGHGAQKRGNQVSQIGHTILFLRRHLK